ncbi:MAG: AMP-binding protein [Desulfovibrio sp.]|nr:AMP-binding protein [Desulfovibrio sp.]
MPGASEAWHESVEFGSAVKHSSSVLDTGTLGQALLAAVESYGGAWFLRLARTDGTFADMDRRGFLDMSLRVAAWLREKGLTPGDPVVLSLENSPAWGAAYFGIILSGGVAVPVDVQSVPADAAYYVQKCRARLVLASHPETFSDDPPTDCVLARGLEEALSHEPLSEADIHIAEPHDVAVLIFTSGTTGRPKAVMLTHENLLANVASVFATGLLYPTDNFLAVLPLHHAYPCMVNLLVPLLLGVRTTYVETLMPEAILAALKKAQVSMLVLTPQYVGVFFRRIRKRFEDLPFGLGQGLQKLLSATAGLRPDPLGPLRRAVRRGLGPDFRFFITGGAKCEPEVMSGMASLGIPVLEGYGLSETSPVISINRPDTGKHGSVGVPLPGIEASIDAPDAEGYGEILVRGKNVMPGYFEDPEATANAFRDGWFRTGDQGRMDPDGLLFVRGRERDIIVLPSGKKFPAEEVEAHYRQAPSVGDICVLQDQSGALRAVVTPNLEFFKVTDSPDVRHNIRWDLEVLSRNLPAYKRVSNVVIVPGELPKTRLGKTKRHLVEKMLAEGRTAPEPGGETWRQLDEAGQRALAAIREVTGAEVISPSSHLELDLGLDSLKRLELLTLLEDDLGRSVPEEAFQQLATARDVVEYVSDFASESSSETVRKNAPTDHPKTRDQRASETSQDAHDAGLTPDLAARVRLDIGLLDRSATMMLAGLIGSVARLGFGLRVRGQENIPEGAAIICPNHASYLDGFMIFAATPMRHKTRLFFLGLARFFEARIIRRLAARFRLIAVDAGKISETMRLSAFVLRHGKLLCVFPEGARTVTGELQEFKKGPVILSKELGVPVVPAAITGTFEAWPVGGRLKRHTVTVTFAKPMMPEDPEEIRMAVSRLLRG